VSGGAPWLSDTREDLPVRRIKFTSYVKARVGWQNLTTDEYQDSGPYLITGTDFVDGTIHWENCRHVSEWRYRQDPYIQLRDGDLLLTKDGTIGKVAVIDQLPGPATLNSGVFVVRALRDYVPRFMFWMLNSSVFSEFIRYKSQGSTIQHLYQNVFETFAFPTPPGQEAIVNFLDRKTAAIDALMGKKERLLELLQEKRQALVTQALTRGLDLSAPMKASGLPWLAAIPFGWSLFRLKQLSHRISGRLVYQPAQYFSDEGVPFIMGNNVTERGISLDRTKFIPLEVNARFAHHALLEGDVVMVRVGAPGVTAVVGPEANGLNCGSLMIVRRNPAFHSPWLAAVMNSPVVRAQIDLVQYGAAQEQINITDAVNFWIPTPPLEEQERIAEFVTRATGQLDQTTDKVREQIARLREYRQTLITATVTGRLAVSKEAA